ADGGDPDIYPYVIILGDIVKTVRSLQASLLSQDTVKETVDQRSVIVIKLDQKIRRINPVHPGGAFLHRHGFTFSGDGVAQNHFSDGLTAEQADGKFFYRADPVGNALVIDFKTELVKHIRRIPETQMAVNISVQIL